MTAPLSTDERVDARFRDTQRRCLELRKALEDLLDEVEYAIAAGLIPLTWLSKSKPEAAISNARKLLDI